MDLRPEHRATPNNTPDVGVAQGQSVYYVVEEGPLGGPLLPRKSRAASSLHPTLPHANPSFQLAYRKPLIAKRAAKEAKLSSAFFLYVYHNEYADRDSIMSYLAEYETNPGLRSLSTDPTAVREVGLVFEYMEHIGADARVAVWFCFFHDLWTTNHKVSRTLVRVPRTP